jgi:flagellar assembly factor FliW
VYKPKIKEEEVQKMDIDPERTTSLDIIQIGTIDVPIENSGEGPIVLNNQVVTTTPKGSVVANDHEARGSNSRPKYFLPRWCPPGLIHNC